MPVYEVDLERDVRAAAAMADRLTPYIYESELYGLMPGDLPRLTVGGLLMRLHRLPFLADQLSPTQNDMVREAQRKFDAVRKEWAVAYEGKVKHELTARLVAIGHFINDCGENPRACVDNYPSAMEKRVIAEVLKSEAEARNLWSPDLRSTLTSLDTSLRRLGDKGPFCWDARVELAYPPDRFWFLYVTPRKPSK